MKSSEPFFCTSYSYLNQRYEKNLLLLYSISLCTLFASAQITKGSVLLGGGLSFGTSKTEFTNNESKQTNYSIGFSAGVAVKQNTIVGGNINFGGSNSKNSNGNTSVTSPKNNNYGAGVFLRKYMPLGKSFYLYGQGGLGYSHSKSVHNTGVDFSSEAKGWNVGLNVTPGIAYALTKKFHLELGFYELAGINYGKSTTENVTIAGTNTSSSSNFGFSTSLGTSTPLNIGFRFLLAK